MKPVSEWDENYILHELPIGEADWFDMKDRRALDLTVAGVEENKILTALSKHISAFSNSGGGQLLLGMQDPKVSQGRHFVADGGVEITFPKKGDTREWLENVISNLVEYPLRKFNVYAITRKDENSEIAEGRAVFVIDIPDSPDAPHQSQEKIYYARVGGRSQPIGHRLVMDIANRRQSPKMNLEFSIVVDEVSSSTYTANHFTMPIHRQSIVKEYTVNLIVAVQNLGKVMAQYVDWDLYIPAECFGEDDEEFNPLVIGHKKVKINGAEHYLFCDDNTRSNYAQNGRSSTWYEPILPNRVFRINQRLNTYWAVHRAKYDENLSIKWTIHADNAPQITGETRLVDINFVDKDDNPTVTDFSGYEEE